MAFTYEWKKRALYLGYQEQDRYPCYLTDSITPYSPYFNVTGLGDTITGGKNLFKINPTENTLQFGSEVLIEIADQFGNAIYTEVTGLTEGQDSLCTVWVYDDFPSKQVTLTVLATAIVDIDGTPINGSFPNGEPYWNGKRSIDPRAEMVRPNIRWTKQLLCEPLSKNTDPIVFSHMPKVRVGEKIRTYFSSSYEGSRITSSMQSASYSHPAGVMPINPISSEMDSSVKGGYVTLPRLTVPSPYFSGSMTGAIIKFEADLIQSLNPSINASKLKPGETLSYEGTIHSVINSTQVRLSTPFEVLTIETVSTGASKANPGNVAQQEILQSNIITGFGTSAMQITHSNPPSYAETENSHSYAICDFKNLIPVAGDVHRIVTKIKSHGTVGEYQIVGDQVLEATELLVDTGSVTMREEWGVMENHSSPDKYWQAEAFAGALVPSLSRDDSQLSNALLVSMSSNISGDDYVHVTTKDQIEFEAGTLYRLSFKSILKRTPDSSITSGYDPLSVKVFLSGSGFIGSILDPDPDVGLYIGNMESSASSIEQFESDYRFKSSRSGMGKPVFKIEAGYEVHLTDISLKAETDNGFTPEQFTLVSFIPLTHNDDLLDFKFELYNPDNVKAEIDLTYMNVDFTGGNTYISNGLLAGTLDIGPDVASSGFVVGGNASAYLRTVNPIYPGFHSSSAGSGSGILLWSGSLGNTIYDGSGDNYKGIGMEMILDSSSYFRFRTDPSELDIRAQKFFVGDDTTQFISGALGNIEISSSKFHLTPAGDVIMAGDITAETGNIGGWAIGDTFLSSSNIILSSSGTMQTADFESSLLGAGVGKGWKIGGDGAAEFENVKIRGTLRTAVFEKDTISAVGGAVIIANATVTTGSDVLSGSMNGNIHGVPSASFQVDTVGGWSAGEYAIVKSVETAGFTNELMKVYSSSINPTPTLHMSRSLNGNTIPTMSAAQVIVSYAKEDQGFIFMNATSGSDTPFIDIMERTGSGHLDIETKVRLGDLSGLNASKVGTNPGHGLFGENVFLTGKLEASVLSGQVVEVVNSNFTQYLSASTAGGGYTLVLDGSAGGKQALNVIITETNSVDPLVIKGILAPDVTNATNVDVNVEIGEEVTAAISIDPDSGGVAGATMKVNTSKFWSAAQSNAIQSNVSQPSAPSSPGV